MKMEPVEWEKDYFQAVYPVKKLISKICRNSYSSNSKKKKKRIGEGSNKNRQRN